MEMFCFKSLELNEWKQLNSHPKNLIQIVYSIRAVEQTFVSLTFQYKQRLTKNRLRAWASNLGPAET